MDAIIIVICVLSLLFLPILIFRALPESTQLHLLNRFIFLQKIIDIFYSYILVNKIGLYYDKNWENAITDQTSIGVRTLEFFDSRNKTASEVQIPQPELDISLHTPKELANHIIELFSEKKLKSNIEPIISFKYLPFAQNRSKNQVIEVLTGTLIENAPKARRSILVAKKISLKTKSIDTAIKIFISIIYKAINDKKKGFQELKLFLNQCYEKATGDSNTVAKGLSFDNFSFNNKEQRKNDDDFSIWNLLEYSMLAGFSYYVNDLDDIEFDVNTSQSIDYEVPEISDSFFHINGNHIDIDGVATVTLPILSTLLEGGKQINLFMDKRVSLASAFQHLVLNVGSKAVGATVGGKVGMIIGTFIVPGAGTWVGGIIGSIFGGMVGGAAAKSIRVRNYNSALNDLKETEERMGKEVDDATIAFYNKSSKSIQAENNRLKDRLNSIKLLIQDQELVVFWQNLIKVVRLDLLYAKDWHGKFNKLKFPTYRLQKIGTEIQNYIENTELVIENLSNLPLDKKIAFIKEGNKMVILTRGNLSRQRKQLVYQLFHANGKYIFGFLLWAFAIEGQYYASVNNTGKTVKSFQKVLSDFGVLWKKIIEEAARKVETKKAQL